jgi:heat-inducible transcriptional repressor
MSIIPPRSLFDDRPSGLAALDERSRNIFRRLVDTYLETGEPVGSRTISRILPASHQKAGLFVLAKTCLR